MSEIQGREESGTAEGVDPWELVVIGAGSAGLTAARTARMLGARVLLIERARWGGDCLWSGCVPSKTLIAQARERRIVRMSGSEAGAESVFAAIDRARQRIAPTDSPGALEAIGVCVLHGQATFTARQSLAVDGRPVRFRRAIVATGSRPYLPGIPGLDEVAPLTSDSIWELTVLPERMLVIGGGAIGCELSQALAGLGVQVTIVQRGSDILPAESSLARSIVRRAMESDGIRIHAGRLPTRFEGCPGGGAVILDDGARLEFDRVLIATGRKATVDDLGLVDAGVDVDSRGWIVSDLSLRTANRSVWAAGDVTWLPKHTHVAGVSGAIACRNAVLGTRKPMRASGAPRVLFTSPEIASIGAVAGGRDRAVTVQHRHLDRAVAEDETTGFTQLVIDRRGRIVGGTIVGPRAGESLGELAVALNRRMTVSELAGVTHAYPTFNDGLWNAAIVESQRRIRAGATARVVGLLRRVNLRRGGRQR
ncbi:FAD-dependent oxidoreductase [Humibacter antri]